MPAAFPVTIPEPEPTEAIAVLELVQLPPDGEELSVVVVPVQTDIVPVLVEGVVLTVACLVEKQPPVSVYVMFDVPDAMPVTMPEPEPTVATPVLALVQVPPEGDELNVVLAPVHTDTVPVIAAGVVLTVTGAIAKHPPARV